MDILEQRLKPSPDAFANAVGDETVLLQVKRGVYYGLDPVGTRIWEGLNAGTPPLQICEQIAADYGQPLETVKSDARSFLEDLTANEIVVAD
jgi:hypothetical protein